eukprot:7370312-Prymnesium_polylepis.1
MTEIRDGIHRRADCAGGVCESHSHSTDADPLCVSVSRPRRRTHDRTSDDPLPPAPRRERGPATGGRETTRAETRNRDSSPVDTCYTCCGG